MNWDRLREAASGMGHVFSDSEWELLIDAATSEGEQAHSGTGDEADDGAGPDADTLEKFARMAALLAQSADPAITPSKSWHLPPAGAAEKTWRNIKFAAQDIQALARAHEDVGDPEFVKAAYEQNWGKQVAVVEKRISGGEPLTSIVLGFDSRNHFHMTGRNKVGRAVVRGTLKHFGVNYTDFNEPPPSVRVGVVNRRYALIPNIDPIEMIWSMAKTKVDHIVELGSGRGNNLFKIWFRLGKRANSKRFYALEYTEAGRRVTQLLAGHAQAEGLQITAHPFDYTQPDISCVPDTGRTIFFSIHSVEQTEVNPALYEQIAARKTPSTLVHFEPVGWQRIPEIVEARRNGDVNFYHAMIARRRENIDSEETQIVNQAINSWRVNYNTNLLECIQNAERDQLCEIVDIHYDYAAWNPVNPTTMIQAAFPNQKLAPAAIDASGRVTGQRSVRA